VVLGRDFFFTDRGFLATDRFQAKSDAVGAFNTSSKDSKELVVEAVSVLVLLLASIAKPSSHDSLSKTELLDSDISITISRTIRFIITHTTCNTLPHKFLHFITINNKIFSIIPE